MQTNPFKPPMSEVADVRPPVERGAPSKALVVVLLILFALHIVIFANYFGLFVALVRTGAMAAIGPMVGLVADVVLFFGIVLLLLKRYSKLTFAVSSVCFLMASKLVWGVPIERILIVLTYGFGAAVAFFGWWVAFCHTRRDI